MKVLLDMKAKNIYQRFWWNYIMIIPLILFFGFYNNLLLLLFGLLIMHLAFIIPLLLDYEYYVYNIVQKETLLEVHYYHWFKNKIKIFDLCEVNIKLSYRGSNLSLLDSIHFMKGKVKLLELHQEKGGHKKYWTEEKVKEMYEILVNMQKEVKEMYGNKNDKSNT